MYYAINRLYNWKGNDKIKSGYVLDYRDPENGKITKGIVTLVKEKGLIGNSNKFVGLDASGQASHYSKKDAVKLNQSPSLWAKEQTSVNGVGMYIVAVAGGYHYLVLVVDRRGNDTTYWLFDQHGNSSTGSSSKFDRLVSHTQQEVDDFMLLMLQSWGTEVNNFNIELFELKRD